MTKLFTEEEVIKLCNAIRSRPSLYDPADGNFGKSLPNKLVWEEIAKLFQYKSFTADDVKLKWKNLRDTMALLLRKSNRDPNTWRFYEYCSFLNDYERPQRKNTRKSLNKSVDEPETKRAKLAPTPTLKSTQVVNNSPDSTNIVPSQRLSQVETVLLNPTNLANITLASIANNSTVTTTPTVVNTILHSRPTATIIAATEEEKCPLGLRTVPVESPSICNEESSRDNFDDASRDSLLQQLASQTPSIVHASQLNAHQHHLQRLQTQSPFISSTPCRDLYDVFGEEVAIRLRALDASNRGQFLQARREMNEILEKHELELYKKQQQQR